MFNKHKKTYNNIKLLKNQMAGDKRGDNREAKYIKI
jgi:hypothetical protein